MTGAGPATSPDPPLRTEASFVTDDLDADDVAALVVHGLLAAGFEPGPVEDLGGPLRLTARHGRRRIAILLGPLPGTPRWLVSAGSGVRPIMRLLGDRADDDRRRLVLAVHQALAGHGAVADLRWYTTEQWSAGDHDAGTASPEG